MKVGLLDIGKLIAANGLKPVTNPILFESGNIPTPDGLLSLEIFGTTSRERKYNYSYIDLNGIFLNPYVYKILKRLDRRIESIVHSSKRYIIDDNDKLVEDEEKGGTGLTWLYKNWDKLKFEKNESNVRNERVALLEAYGKNVLFCRQWVVLPAYYRDVNFKNVDSGQISHNELTDLYCKLLKFANMLQSSSEFDFMVNSTVGKIQETLVEIYDYFKHKIEKKTGLIRKALLGKSVDYGVRAVIAAPEFTTNKYDENIIDFWHCGVPVSLLCTLFFPFMLHELRNFFKEQYEMLGNRIEDLSQYDSRLNGSADLAPFDFVYNEDYYKKIMDTYTRSYEDRFNKVEIPLAQPANFPIYYKITLTDKDGKEITRDMTYTDLLFIVANRACADKHVFITRYPITNHLGTFPSKLNVMSTVKTQPMTYNGTYYKYYPIVKPEMRKEDVATFFYDVLKMSNVLLKALGGDYDGDQVSIKGIFTAEANAECDRLVRGKANILDIGANNVRKSTNENVQTLYTLTKRIKDVKVRKEKERKIDATVYEHSEFNNTTSVGINGKKYKWEQAQIDGVLYYKANDYIKSTKGMYAMATRSDSGNIILTDNLFEKLSENGKRFVLYHELGHIKNGDLSKVMTEKQAENIRRKRIKKILRNQVLDLELNADAFAVKKMGKELAIKGLNEMYNITLKTFDRQDKEILLRIEAIQENFK